LAAYLDAQGIKHASGSGAMGVDCTAGVGVVEV